MSIFEFFGGKKGDPVTRDVEGGVERNVETLAKAFSTLVPDRGINESNVLRVIESAVLSDDEINMVITAIEENDPMNGMEFDITREKVIAALTVLKAEQV